MALWKIDSEEKPKPEDLKHLIGRLRAFNDAHSPIPFARQDLRLFARDETGAILGGLLGTVQMHCLVIQIMWVEEEMRGKGLGRQLMAEAEAQATKAGALQSILETTSFQAPGFYQKLGYAMLFEVRDAPMGASTIFLQKSLR